MSLPTKGRIYCDACIWIYAVEAVAPFETPLRRLFDDVDRGNVNLVTSELSLLEVLVKPLQVGDEPLCRAFETALSPSDALAVTPISRSILLEAARMRSRQVLRVPDAIHLATAKLSKADVVLTNDVRWRSQPDIPVMILSEVLCN